MRKKVLYLFLALLLVTAVAPGVWALPIAGSTSGVFINPQGPIGMDVSGVGTSFFEWGTAYPDRSSLLFTGNAFNTQTETQFKVGDLLYHNGIIVGGTGADSVDLAATLNFTDPAGVNQSFTYLLQLINTPNVGTPEENADYVLLPTSFPSNTFNVGGVDYTLQLLGFGNVSGGGFTQISSFHVLEGESASADLFGKVTHNIPQPVPEASSILLAFSGVGTLGGMALRRKK